MSMLVEQLRLEQEAHTNSMANYDAQLARMLERGNFGDSKEAILVIKVTINALAQHIEEYYELPLRGRNKQTQLYLRQMMPKSRDCALMLIRAIISPLVGGRQKALSLARKIETTLRVARDVNQLQVEAPNLSSYIERRHKHLGDAEIKKELIKASRRATRGISMKELSLGSEVIGLVHKSGCNLIDVYTEGGVTYVELSNATKELLMRSKFFFGSMLTTYYPMVEAPRDWEGLRGSGGYYSYKDIPFIKTKNVFDKRALEVIDCDLTRLQLVINKVQQQEWKVNTRVLNVVETIIKSNLVDVRSSPMNPVLYGDIPYMDTIDTTLLITKSDYGEVDENGRFLEKEAKNRWLRAVKEQEIRNKGIESKRLQYKLALDVARKFKKYDKFYFTYQVDFRGRLYPIQQFLNPQGSDTIKPLLEFAKGARINEQGLRWLMVHGANCYGYDKLTYNERVSKIKEMEGDIKRIAKDPIGSLKLWYDADSPLMFLAFCFAYNDYLQDPNVEITIPVQLDATCSGLQMYAGLLKDRQSALSVNVVKNGEGVNDVYLDVANKVNEYLQNGNYPKELSYKTKDKTEHTVSTAREALSIKGKVTRKLTKRNVMTQPYSVTDRGMFDQVYELLTEHQDNNTVFWEGDKFVVAKLLSSLNARAIDEIVQGAKVGQRAIKAILRKSLETEKQALWFTPIFSFPVLQRIMREKEERLRTPLGRLVLKHPTKQVHYMRMLNGIAPNFIHSLDATLLYRTVELCQEKGVEGFWLIHDSYGVLPNDVDILNESFREAFVELFEGNPLKDFAEQLLGVTAGKVVDKIMINTLNLKEVHESEYIIC